MSPVVYTKYNNDVKDELFVNAEEEIGVICFDSDRFSNAIKEIVINYEQVGQDDVELKDIKTKLPNNSFGVIKNKCQILTEDHHQL